MNLFDDLYLFLQTPVEFLYLYTYPVNRKVKILPFDPALKRQGERLAQKLRRLLPGISVHFVGSVALGLPGQRDIDLFLGTEPQAIPGYLPRLKALLGEPVKVRRRFVEWNTETTDFHLDVILADKRLRLFRDPVKLNRLLTGNPSWLDEYRRIKQKANGMIIRDYQKTRLRFFNRVLGLPPVLHLLH